MNFVFNRIKVIPKDSQNLSINCFCLCNIKVTLTLAMSSTNINANISSISSVTKTLMPSSELRYDMSQSVRFPTIWYVRPAKPQISLRIRAV